MVFPVQNQFLNAAKPAGPAGTLESQADREGAYASMPSAD